MIIMSELTECRECENNIPQYANRIKKRMNFKQNSQWNGLRLLSRVLHNSQKYGKYTLQEKTHAHVYFMLGPGGGGG